MDKNFSNEQLNKQQLNDALTEVRRAYRLLYLYQRRVLDIVNFIGNKMSLNFDSGWSKFSNPAGTKKKVHLNNWAWDWLTLYCYQFYFGAVADNIGFSLVLLSDSGFFESEKSGDELEKLKIDNFVESEKSSTKLYFVAVKAKDVWSCPIHHFLKYKFKSKEPEFAEEMNDRFWLAKSYDLTEFLNEDSTIKVINDFLKFSENNGIFIKEEVKQST